MTTARNFAKGRVRPIQVIFLHTMQTPETEGRANQVAKWFAGATAPVASANVCVDDLLIVRSVDDVDTAWGVIGGNDFGWHLEMSGMANQNKLNWADKYSLGVLKNASVISAKTMLLHNLANHHLTASELVEIKNGNKILTGFAGHDEAVQAFKLGDHTDPGFAFPYIYYQQLVDTELNVLKGINVAPNATQK